MIRAKGRRGEKAKGGRDVGAAHEPPVRTFPSADYADYADSEVAHPSSCLCGSPQNGPMQFAPTMLDHKLRPRILAALS